MIGQSQMSFGLDSTQYTTNLVHDMKEYTYGKYYLHFQYGVASVAHDRGNVRV